jgi:cobyrinic acid a,c-diamide synthase
LILAAPASGNGKTLLTAGLVRHLSRQGLRVATAKAGPDFIDPSFHALATGQPSVNLDTWAMRPATLAGLVTELEAGADIVLCEGVMGLFDGTGADGETGSTAELACITGWPVVLIVDARGQGASIAALVRGFASHHPLLPLAGVIFNRVASDRHRSIMVGALARHLPSVACLGGVPADPGLALPARHLGLVPAAEVEIADRVISHCAAQLDASIDVERLLGLARSSVLFAAGAVTPLPVLGQRIAVAQDVAFCFAYPPVLAGWRRQGAELSFFSPINDEAPDVVADSVYLPGGYPELWAGRLASAEQFRAGLGKAAADGKTIHGECGGYMVLGETLIDGEGVQHRMAGLLPLVTSFAQPRLHLGYRCITLLENGPLGSTGSRFCGHEFHYASVVEEAAGAPLFASRDAAGVDLGTCGLRHGSVFGSFIHLIDRCDEWQSDPYCE